MRDDGIFTLIITVVCMCKNGFITLNRENRVCDVHLVCIGVRSKFSVSIYHKIGRFYFTFIYLHRYSLTINTRLLTTYDMLYSPQRSHTFNLMFVFWWFLGLFHYGPWGAKWTNSKKKRQSSLKSNINRIYANNTTLCTLWYKHHTYQYVTLH